MAVNIGLSFGLAAAFERWGLPPHGGLALANPLATSLEACGLLILMRRRLGGLDFARIRPGLAATLAASVLMTAILLGWLSMGQNQGVWEIGLGGVAVGGASYWVASLLLRSPEARQLPALLLKRDRS